MKSSTHTLAPWTFALLKAIRPLLGSPGGCLYTVSCTEYAQFALQNYNFLKALWCILQRFLSCH